MKYVSKVLPHKTSVKPTEKVYNIDHDMELKNNFWSYVKHYIEKPKHVIPTFDKSKCYKFFKRKFKCLHPSKIFYIPSWIPKFAEPKTPFDLNPPSYQEINKVINRMKTSGSPCLLDQISVICFKRCLY